MPGGETGASTGAAAVSLHPRRLAAALDAACARPLAMNAAYWFAEASATDPAVQGACGGLAAAGVVACRGVMAQCTGYTMNKQSGGW
jgi:hypothetical protein